MEALTFLTGIEVVSLLQTLSQAVSKLLEYKSVWMVEGEIVTTFLSNDYGARAQYELICLMVFEDGIHLNKEVRTWIEWYNHMVGTTSFWLPQTTSELMANA